ncbi:uncharacterized protein N7479_009776 [Penicillium vulpinum]|uniref:Uncharacterized protein n=1 Tax=Penicillium vulpinum TaxID=29845 RepID=A0A1V6RYN6_9EURO|nr:uncharacterized protein N7479_009776 [Penicillium vulpinum]KAJ5951363.1 hypothetical protein N7479_009776 [Penicillium vulpinum]OQE06543.1 hypothetical protein PENVUL_c017G04089 [Penicillium vulpinum]
MEKSSLETQNPLRQNAPSPRCADTYKEFATSPRPTTENSMNEDCTLEVNDRDYSLELTQYADDKYPEHTDRQPEAGAGATDENQADARQDPEIQSVTGTVKRHRSRRPEWILFGSILGAIVLLVVIIVPSVIFGTRHSSPQFTPPANPYIA